jgi:probable rRNA maturation factor
MATRATKTATKTAGKTTSTGKPAAGKTRKAAPAAPPPPAETVLSLSVQYNVAEEVRLPRWRLRRWVAQALAALDGPAGASFTLRLVGAAEGRRLNRDFRERDYATNVLTFEYGADPAGTVHGDIVICVPVLVREAKEQKKPFLHHAAHLVIHATLHALGYDHLDPEQEAEMESLEIEILARMAIPDPYQVS